jgi:hypothetical protein|nr:MAG TPA: hypothetical protein [Caudoviricetes sp.]
MKLIDDTLKKKDGTWDKQALTFFASFVMSILLGITLTGLSFFLNIVINPVAENVFNSFIMLTGVMSGTNIWNKIVDYRKESKE